MILNWIVDRNLEGRVREHRLQKPLWEKGVEFKACQLHNSLYSCPFPDFDSFFSVVITEPVLVLNNHTMKYLGVAP